MVNSNNAYQYETSPRKLQPEYAPKKVHSNGNKNSNKANKNPPIDTSIDPNILLLPLILLKIFLQQFIKCLYINRFRYIIIDPLF